MKLQVKLILGPEAERKKKDAQLIMQKEALKIFPNHQEKVTK